MVRRWNFNPNTITLFCYETQNAALQLLSSYCWKPGFELSKNKWGVDICLFIVIVITHRRFSIINNGGGLKLTPRVSQGILFGGLSK
jgi:hypothetical protein